MSEWNRRGRDDAPGGYGEPRETRSFDFERDWVDPEQGGYTGESDGGREVRRQPDPRPGWRDQDARARFERHPVRGDKDYRGDVYRAPEVEGRGPRPSADYRSEGYRPEAYRSGDYRSGDYSSEGYRSPGYGREGGVVGRNPALDRIVDDPSGRGWREDVGRHRGHGPRNWVRSDSRIHEDVSDALCDDPWLDASEIEVEVHGGEVTLRGAVHSRSDRGRAEDLAWRPGGVKQVQNDLRVQPTEAGQTSANAQGRPG